ncbi:MAG TPA: SgcJ/EcaC family oxidoreductase [Bryobacteraceae bacterium]|nr:SgcJ/EcaC family oxidoreductase [Bryobacteraceae bacterium]
MTADEGAIQDILKQFEAAWNRYDSVGIGALFAEDANFIHIFGGQLDGRTAIEAAHRVIFNTIYRGSHASFPLRSIRFLRPDVAVVFARAHVQFKEGDEAREIETRPTLVVVKEQAKWQVVAFQNTKISEVPTAAQAAARLAT